MRSIILTTTVFALSALGQFRENTSPAMTCDQRHQGDRDYPRICDIKEMRIPATQRLEIDPGANGGITVRGWNRNEVWVRARIDAYAKAGEAQARDLASQVRIETSGGRIAAAGNKRDQDAWWSVSLEIFAPHRIDVDAKTNNGGVTLQDLEGRLTFATSNGGVNLARLAGDVKGRTSNGGVNVDLMGERWQGAGLDVTTTNGGVTLLMPANYSADFQAGTQNGSFTSDFGTTERGTGWRARKQLEQILGNGGPPVRVKTTNGGVRLKKK